jgi:hypothetical protein
MTLGTLRSWVLGLCRVNVCRGTLIAECFSGDQKRAKPLYRALKKDYPQFGSTAALKQLPTPRL